MGVDADRLKALLEAHEKAKQSPEPWDEYHARMPLQSAAAQALPSLLAALAAADRLREAVEDTFKGHHGRHFAGALPLRAAADAYDAALDDAGVGDRCGGSKAQDRAQEKRG